MKMQSNTILITGGTSGIGRGLAEAFHKLGNQVIISGRREENLRHICAAHPGMRYFVLDVGDPHSIRHVAYPDRPRISTAQRGVQQRRRPEAAGLRLRKAARRARRARGDQHQHPRGVRMSAEFIPQLAGKPNATLVNVSSGLAFAPLTFFPVYCATKAFVHSLSLTLRHQLKGKGIKVVELVPPYVSTELGGTIQKRLRSAARRACTHAARCLHCRNHERACRRRR